ncbi:MAG: hypothetical protein KME57_35490 [Scytonema hyalinum WJT4-NPBG1]|nr:hypothetical protein [Scytonema hyalinum WJT4-NPBG1]
MTSFFAVAFLGTLPAIAELGTVWTDFQFYTSDFRNYITNNISDSFSPVELQTQSAITNSSGDLNIPNPNDAAKSVRDQINQYPVSDKFESNPAVYSAGVSNEINRYITRSSVEGLLGRDGQTRLKTKFEDTEKAVQDSNKSAQDAATKKQEKQTEIETLVPDNIFDELIQKVESKIPSDSSLISALSSLQSQRVLAKIMKQTWEGLSELELQNINIQREQTRIMGETLGNTIQLRNDIQYSNLNLADISQQMNEVNRARRVDTSAEVARLLRVTSQTDLFRKSSASPSLESPPPSVESSPPDLENNPPDSENSPPPVLEPGE